MKKIIIAQYNKTDISLLIKNDIQTAAGLSCHILNYNDNCNSEQSDTVIFLYTIKNTAPSSILQRDIYDGVFIYSDGIPAHDNKLISDWTGTPHLRIIPKQSGQYKYMREHIFHLLGYPQSYETERKFLIKYPNIEMLENLSCCAKTNITQIYLKPDKDGNNIRIRKRGNENEYIYIKTQKTFISDIKRIENETFISKSEYERLSAFKNTELNAIVKNRYCLMYNNTYFEIDIFPFWKNQAYIECELLNEDDSIVFPEFIDIIKEVTYDKKYTNRSLAKHIPQEADI